ncbi:uncharacterized protein LOC131059687 [Cryptomeria japonica]|uniref:uncharacterized protein LOC131059687 n=1 Tax=Cryptomeria japonica TaxID=3369 RepID=UPI0027DA6F05|nr:uncharacterized protein LOC131059687 [Cryptomeria japonica]
MKPRPERTRARSGAEGRPGRRAGGAAGDAGAEGGGATGRAGSCTGGGAVGREGAPRRRCSRAGTGGSAAGREAVGGAGAGAAAEGGSACCGRCLVQSASVAERAEGTAGRRGQTAHGTVDGVYGRCQARSTASAAQVRFLRTCRDTLHGGGEMNITKLAAPTSDKNVEPVTPTVSKNSTATEDQNRGTENRKNPSGN